MRFITNLLIAVASAIFLSGCAFTNATLQVEYDEAHATKGPISRVKPLTFEMVEFTDSRKDKDRIGFKRNGFGQKTADITTEMSVTDIVEESLRTSLLHNGHELSELGTILVKGDVSEFWFDFDPNFWTIRFMGTVESRVEFTNTATGSIIYANDYRGYYEKETGGGLEKTWTEVMKLALENMIDSIVKDPALALALGTNSK